ncbi:MAG: hypothetical protein LBJ87_09395 [bacterium]|nr:hypothetical protein [bacterium]
MSSEHIEARRREREERRRIRDQEHQERRESAQREREQRRAQHSRLRGGGRDNVVACRLDDADLAALDALVEAGVRSTRSDAAAWLIKAGLEVNKPLLDDVSGTVTEIRRLRGEAVQKARRFAGTATPDPGPGEEAATAASSRPASDAGTRATDQHLVQGGDD